MNFCQQRNGWKTHDKRIGSEHWSKHRTKKMEGWSWRTECRWYTPGETEIILIRTAWKRRRSGVGAIGDCPYIPISSSFLAGRGENTTDKHNWDIRNFKGKMLTTKKKNKIEWWREWKGRAWRWKCIHFIMFTELGNSRNSKEKSAWGTFASGQCQNRYPEGGWAAPPLYK